MVGPIGEVGCAVAVRTGIGISNRMTGSAAGQPAVSTTCDCRIDMTKLTVVLMVERSGYEVATMAVVTVITLDSCIGRSGNLDMGLGRMAKGKIIILG